MAFEVSVAYGDTRLSAVFSTEIRALGEARNQIALDATDVRIEIVATGEQFTYDEFRAKMASRSKLR